MGDPGGRGVVRHSDICHACGYPLKQAAPDPSDGDPQSDKLLRVILDNVADLIAVVDTTGKRLYNSPSYREVLDDPEALRGTNSFDEIHPDDRERIRRIFQDTLQHGVGQTAEYRFLRKDGSVRYIESQGNVVRDAAGQPTKVVVVSRDITERKLAEEELRSAYRELQETQAQLIQAEKLASIGQMAAGMAHELKNPLGIIVQGLRYFERELGSKNEEQTTFLSMMLEAAHRADDLIRRVLKFSHPSPLALKPCAIQQIIDSAVELVERQLAAKHIRVVKEVPDGLPLAKLDENQTLQVFINVILNAFQAMPDGGTLTICCAAKTLDKPGYRIGNRTEDFFRVGETVLVCEIADTGIGISQEDLSKVFDPFFTTKPTGEGTGLGLSITRRIIDAHRGLIQVDSRKGKGTTVTLMLPIA